jgi:hypothetical protein
MLALAAFIGIHEIIITENHSTSLLCQGQRAVAAAAPLSPYQAQAYMYKTPLHERRQQQKEEKEKEKDRVSIALLHQKPLPVASLSSLRLFYPMAPYGPSNQIFGLQEATSMAALLNCTLILPVIR